MLKLCIYARTDLLQVIFNLLQRSIKIIVVQYQKHHTDQKKHFLIIFNSEPECGMRSLSFSSSRIFISAWFEMRTRSFPAPYGGDAAMHVLDVEISICAHSQIMEYVPPSAAVTRAASLMSRNGADCENLKKARKQTHKHKRRRRARRRKSIATALVFIGLVMRHDHNFLRQ